MIADEYKDLLRSCDWKIKKYNLSILKLVYQDLIKREAGLIRDIAKSGSFLGLDDDDIYFSIYRYLLLNGYLSLNCEFTVTNDNLTEILGNIGLAIPSGSGCCRNVAVNFNKIMEILSTNERLILVGTHPKYIDYNEFIVSDIEYDIDKDYSSHVENLLLNKRYLYDVLNFSIKRLKVTGENYEKARVIAMDHLLDAILKDGRNIKSRLKFVDDEARRIKDGKIITKFELLDQDYLERIYYVGEILCLGKLDQIKRFADENQDVYRYIKEKTKKIM